MKTLIKLFIGIILILFTLWLRILYTRIPRLFEEEFITWLSLVSLVILILISLLMLIINIKIILNIRTKGKILTYIINLTWIQVIFEIIKTYIINSPAYVYTYLSERYSFNWLVEKPASYLTVYCNYPKLISFSLLLLPRALISFLFVFDVCYFHAFDLFFKSLIILLIPLTVNVYIFIVETYANGFLEYLNKYLIFTPSLTNTYYVTLTTIEPKEGTSLNLVKPKFKAYVNLWEIYTEIHAYILRIKDAESLIKPYMLIFTHLSLTFGWVYYILYIML